MDPRRKMSSVSKHGESDCTPICRCRVLYLGSAVPHVTKDGLQGIQEPLRELYPEKGAVGAKGIDSWLSVWSNGLLLENVDENHKRVTRFFPIETLHYCAAVRYVRVPNSPGAEVEGGKEARFLPLDSPFARMPSVAHPPLFAAILRRTTGIKVLECHAFICKREAAANALVRCCFHAYADSAYARQLEEGENENENGGSSRSPSVVEAQVALDSIEKVHEWRSSQNGHNGISAPANGGVVQNGVDAISAYGDETQTPWKSPKKAPSRTGTVRSARSIVGSIFGGKSSKPRQMIIPDAAPPPPPMVEDKKKKKGKHKSVDDVSVVYHPSAHPMSNGLRRPASVINLSSGESVIMGPGRPSSQINGYGPPPMMAPGPGMLPPGAFLVPVPPPATLKKSKKFGTFAGRGKKTKTPQPVMVMPPPLIGPMVPPPNYPPYHLPYPAMTMQRPGTRMSAMEEPIYMPGMGRPVSPEASYQPANYPHDVYLQQQPYPSTLERSKLMKKKRLSKEQLDNDGSVVDAGIYRKGYLNEKAFSHSIRQEHRSRSYGSLASLQINGDGSLREEDKKERELRQLVRELDLSSDELERIEVPPEMYKQTKNMQKPQR